MDIEKKLFHAEFLNREYSVSHLSYEREMAFLRVSDLEIPMKHADYSSRLAAKKLGKTRR